MPVYRCLVLDLDGTVLDSHAYTFAAFRHACAPFGAVPDDATLYAHFGPDERVILAALLGRDHAAAAYTRLQEYYAAHAAGVRAHADMPRLLEACRRHGIARGLFTGRGSDSTRLLLHATALATHFDAVVAGDEAPPKPRPDGILWLLQRLQRAPHETLVVGDSPLDLEAASRAGTHAALATWFARGASATTVAGRRLAAPAELLPLLGCVA